MTQPLRKAHVVIWMVLAIALVAVIGAGLAFRRETAPANTGWRWERVR